MLTNKTRAVLLEALEYRKRKTIEFGDFTPKEAEEELAELNAAIAEVNAEARWVPVEALEAIELLAKGALHRTTPYTQSFGYGKAGVIATKWLEQIKGAQDVTQE